MGASVVPASAGAVGAAGYAVDRTTDAPGDCGYWIGTQGGTGTVTCAALVAGIPLNVAYHVAGDAVESAGMVASIPGACVSVIQQYGIGSQGAVGCAFVAAGWSAGAVYNLTTNGS